VTDVAGGITEYTYDTYHRLLTVKVPRGIVFLTNQYDANGRVSLQTLADTGTFQFNYTVETR
jgi:YD repeat-containing protein